MRRAEEWSQGDLSQLHKTASVNIHLLFSPTKLTGCEQSVADEILKVPSFFLLHNSYHSISMFEAYLMVAKALMTQAKNESKWKFIPAVTSV